MTWTIYAHAGPFLLAQTIGPTGPIMLDIFGPAGPSMYLDQIFCYRDSTTQCRINNRTSHRSKANTLFHKVYVPCSYIVIKTHDSESRGQEETQQCDHRVIKTHDSESRGQEEAQQSDHRVSYLYVAPPSNSQTL